MPTAPLPARLDVSAASDQLFFFLGAAVSGLFASSDERTRHTAEELWRLLPFVKALTAVGLASPVTLEILWRKCLDEPMPIGVPEAAKEVER